MRKFLLAIAACGLGLTLTTAAEARPAASHGHRGHEAHPYYRTHARSFRGGYYYVGQQHHWTRRVWDARYSRWTYWDPGLAAYFYWYAPGNCYYPVTYCP